MNLRPEAFVQVRAILFDVDGTLFSSEEIIHDIYIAEFSAAKERLGRPANIPTKPEVLDQIGKPVPIIFSNLAPDLTRAEQDDVSDRVLKRLVSTILGGGGHHYEGVRETLHELKARGYALYTASNGREPYVRSILTANQILGTFAGLPVIQGNVQNKTQLVTRFLEDQKIKPEEVALIGDRTSDRDAAIENGVPFIACRFGHGNEKEWEGAAIVVDSIRDLLDLFRIPSGIAG
ncbi:MAG: HAD hydrolase-like protein [Spirochaetia bacterium]|nr:HAD hydrolase-like protein [Spirochaetia bacterium]